MRGPDAPDLEVDISAARESADETSLLATITASFFERGDSCEEIDVGTLTGWMSWNTLDEDLADAADAISVDTAHIGFVGSLALGISAGD